MIVKLHTYIQLSDGNPHLGDDCNTFGILTIIKIARKERLDVLNIRTEKFLSFSAAVMAIKENKAHWGNMPL